ncbi:response regulator transcription factor [Caballeronia sp. LP006]|jgi:DNA-binding response OmpR family regulator|uniref:response regulator transcription factor n=1 Tax=unclassified Caballeronia TaxID=2646786 RepID=UPI001FD451BA|nr:MULTISPECIES: response regulator transcription factor [unclassified Caballeronia]MDR5774469.1 response regulator transcription factor [Caballeronia sp. LZ002]MDR5799920.1 response regulator transcription factor [Caballeronia sp. LZ001]MDR5827929.1 response regulator transcription factor [Caballeronia sp. LP006]MDR5849905.1 response regulator transcription factor [Caballeronia sp. LZ003]
MKLLLIEDNRQLAHWLSKTLTDEGFLVEHVPDGETAGAALAGTRYDVVLLDLNLPGMSGKAVLRRMRDQANDTPVLVLTATGDIGEKVICLADGADDYVVKPFDERELIARIKALARRHAPVRSNRLRCGTLLYDMDRRQFFVGDDALSLTPREHAVLEALILQTGRTVSKAVLAEALNDRDAPPSGDAIEIYVSRVRKKIEKSTAAIITLRGLGYLLEHEEPQA